MLHNHYIYVQETILQATKNVGDFYLWAEIELCFKGFPAQLKVARLLFERGFQVTDNRKIVSGGIEIAYTQIAKEAGIGRRAVDSTIDLILSDPKLKKIFSRLRQVCLLDEAASELGMSCIRIVPENAFEKGVLTSVTQKLFEEKLNILQAFAEHPDMSLEPKIIIVVDGNISPKLIGKLKNLPTVRNIIY